jgi:hypothetical protein
VHNHHGDALRVTTQFYVKPVAMGYREKEFPVGFEFWIKLLHGVDSIKKCG